MVRHVPFEGFFCFRRVAAFFLLLLDDLVCFLVVRLFGVFVFEVILDFSGKKQILKC